MNDVEWYQRTIDSLLFDLNMVRKYLDEANINICELREEIAVLNERYDRAPDGSRWGSS